MAYSNLLTKRRIRSDRRPIWFFQKTKYQARGLSGACVQHRAVLGCKCAGVFVRKAAMSSLALNLGTVPPPLAWKQERKVSF